MQNEVSALCLLHKKGKTDLLYTIFPLWLTLLLLPQWCCTTSDASLTFSRSLHSAGPLVPLPGTCGGAERARFCFLFLLSHSRVLAQGQRHLKFPAGWSQSVTVGLVPHSAERSPLTVSNQLHSTLSLVGSIAAVLLQGAWMCTEGNAHAQSTLHTRLVSFCFSDSLDTNNLQSSYISLCS